MEARGEVGIIQKSAISVCVIWFICGLCVVYIWFH